SHFGRAAEACSISQPALSMQIKEMEETLGGVLLERSARQVTLTKFGEEIVQRVREILRSIDELGDFARASRDRLAGRLRIGMIPTIAPYLLPKVIENLARLHPELDIHVRVTLREPPCQAMRDCARCGCFCSRKGTAFATRHWRFATCSRRPARCWMQA